VLPWLSRIARIHLSIRSVCCVDAANYVEYRLTGLIVVTVLLVCFLPLTRHFIDVDDITAAHHCPTAVFLPVSTECIIIIFQTAAAPQCSIHFPLVAAFGRSKFIAAIESSRQPGIPIIWFALRCPGIDANPDRLTNDTELHWLSRRYQKAVWRNHRPFVIRKREHVCPQYPQGRAAAPQSDREFLLLLSVVDFTVAYLTLLLLLIRHDADCRE
jgi:hypothetical protein